MSINKNMLRERGKGMPKMTDEKYMQINEHNREIMEEFLDANKHLSKQSLSQYKSGLSIFFYYVAIKLKNKSLFQITKRDFIRYFGYLQDYGLSSSALKLKKSAVSTICIYCENILSEEEEDYKNFRNFTKAVTDIPNNKVYDKIPMTIEEYAKVMDYLLEKENYLGMSYLCMAFMSGARKGELMQFKTDIINYEKGEGLTYYETHMVRGKGRSVDGKPIKYMFNDDAMKYAKLWVENRGYECDYLFSTKYNGAYKQISEGWANEFCKNIISVRLGRRINPHILRASACTYLLESGKDFKAVSKLVLHHSSTAVTSLYDLRSDDEAKNSIYE
jgi:integrase